MPDVLVRVPASSANLGPGFDALGMALSLHAVLGTGRALADDAGSRDVDEHHPALIAFRRAGGEGPLRLRCPIPMGRGLGFSGAVRVAGLMAAQAQRGEPVDVLAEATVLERHADNAAASLLGGVVATAGGRAVRVPLGFDPTVVVWVPTTSTSTDDSRKRLPAEVSRSDAVFNVGRTALLVAAFAAGDVDALRTATEDRLHQDTRFAAVPQSRAALDAALEAGAWCGWLSGSGPTVATLCATEAAASIAESMPSDGHTKVLTIDTEGAVIL